MNLIIHFETYRKKNTERTIFEGIFFLVINFKCAWLFLFNIFEYNANFNKIFSLVLAANCFDSNCQITNLAVIRQSLWHGHPFKVNHSDELSVDEKQ